jgi:hypothetical protein
MPYELFRDLLEANAIALEQLADVLEVIPEADFWYISDQVWHIHASYRRILQGFADGYLDLAAERFGPPTMGSTRQLAFEETLMLAEHLAQAYPPPQPVLRLRLPPKGPWRTISTNWHRELAAILGEMVRELAKLGPIVESVRPGIPLPADLGQMPDARAFTRRTKRVKPGPLTLPDAWLETT